MGYILAAVLGYLLGCSNMAYYISKWKKTDFRSAGSGNLGASNATVLFGWGAGVAVAVHDIGKAVLAVFLAQWLFAQPYAGAVAGVSCVMGHIFPFYLKFRGGKGLASFIGMAIALNWKVAAAAIVLLVIITVVTDYIVLGTLAVVAVVPVGIGIVTGDWVLPVILLCATVVIVLKHRENIRRIRNHTEIGLRSTAKGENRIGK